MPPLLPLCYANALFPTSSSAIRYIMSVSHPTLTLDWFHLTTTHMSVVASGHMPALPWISPSYINTLFLISSPARYIMSVSHPTLTLDWFRLNTTQMNGVAEGHTCVPSYSLAIPMHFPTSSPACYKHHVYVPSNFEIRLASFEHDRDVWIGAKVSSPSPTSLPLATPIHFSYLFSC